MSEPEAKKAAVCDQFEYVGVDVTEYDILDDTPETISSFFANAVAQHVDGEGKTMALIEGCVLRSEASPIVFKILKVHIDSDTQSGQSFATAETCVEFLVKGLHGTRPTRTTQTRNSIVCG